METLPEVKRGRGRPPGVRREPTLRNWQPKTWTPVHQAVVLRFCAGTSQEELSKEFELSKVHINNIINCELGQALVKKVKDELLSKGNPAEKLAFLQSKTIDRMVDFVNNDSLATNAPVAFIRESNKIHQIASGLNPDTSDPQKGPTTLVNPLFMNINIMKDLKDSFDFMKTVHAIHGPPVAVIGNGDS